MKTTLLAALLAAVPASAQLSVPRTGLAPVPPLTVLSSTPSLRSVEPSLSGFKPLDAPLRMPSSLSPESLDRLFDGGAKKGSDWEFRAAFGPSRSKYYDTDIRVHSSKIDGTFTKAQLSERDGMDNYQFWDKSKTGNPFKWIDEPTNRLVLSAENKRRGYVVNLIYTHPKVLVVDGDKANNAVHFQGTIEGQAVDKNVRLHDYFFQWMMTYGLADVSVNFEKTFPLARGRLGSLDYAPGVGLGVVTSGCNVTYRVPGTEWDGVSYDQPLRLAGYSGSLSNRLTYTFPNGRFNASIMQDVTVSRLHYGFMDGWAEQNLNYQTLWFGLGARLGKTKKPAARQDP